MPVFGESVAGAFAGDRAAIELAAEADGEVADVDDFLDFAAGFGGDFADFQRDECRQVAEMGADEVAETADQFAAGGGGGVAPSWKRLPGR